MELRGPLVPGSGITATRHARSESGSDSSLMCLSHHHGAERP